MSGSPLQAGVRRGASLLLSTLLVFGAGQAACAEAVDVELVLAVDASASVDDREFTLQLSGIANAFRDTEVLSAIAGGTHGRIAVALALWAESSAPKDSTPWHLISDAASGQAFANTVESFPRRISGGTGLGRGLFYAMGLIRNSGFTGLRRVIDLSGDGRETTFRDWSVGPNQARAAASATGITINGLAIVAEEPDLASYYGSEVITGPDAFVIAVENFEDFARAMRDKLLREIRTRPNISAIETRSSSAPQTFKERQAAALSVASPPRPEHTARAVPAARRSKRKAQRDSTVR